MAKRYTFKVNPTGDIYEFESIGPKGVIRKVVRFDESDTGYYNLALGDVRENGAIDFKATSNNNDILTVLNTVAAIIEYFNKIHPRSLIFIQGNDDKRTKTYQWRLKRSLQLSASKFGFLGLKEDTYSWELFNESEVYAAFLVVPLE